VVPEIAGLAGRCCLRWSLDLDSTMTGGASCVFAGRQDTGRRVVLKLTPDPAIAASEAAALRAWAAIPQAEGLPGADWMPGQCCWKNCTPAPS
jgi:streptomycin 6-kinase